jgi:hypothetical protein
VKGWAAAERCNCGMMLYRQRGNVKQIFPHFQAELGKERKREKAGMG